LNELSNKEVRACCAAKRILIAGGTGYLAGSLVGLLKDVECHIVRLGRAKENFVPVAGVARTEDIVGDVRELAVWERALEGVDIVFHLAAQTSVSVANRDARADLEANVIPMVHLLEVCRQRGLHPIVLFSGTVTEAGIASRLPVDESQADHPVTIYDLHKLMAENYLKYYAAQRFVYGASLRLANVYGPGPKSSSVDRGILNMMIRRALAGEPVTVYGQGERLRDYVFVEDVARAFVFAAAAIERTNGQHFVIGSGEGHTIAEAMTLVSKRVALRAGVEVPVVYVDPPQPQSPIEARDFVADTRLFSQLTGWRSLVSLVEGIDRTIEATV
jgi:nucleoside-diphosphate-sugar epimerase